MRLRLALLALLLPLFACDSERSRDSSGPRTVCGNGAVETGEVCEPDDLQGASCASVGFGAGPLACARGCRAFDTSACGAPAGCGDGTVAAPELCDGPSLAGRTCQSLGLGAGTLVCLANCGGFDTSGCSTAAPPDAGTFDAGSTTSDGGASPSCTGVTCAGHGRCAIAGADVLCLCDSGYHADGLDCVMDVNGSPIIDRVDVSVSELREGSSVTFTATVRDPDGLGDIGGGTLESPGGARYALFTAVGPGQYEATISWAMVDAVETIAFVGQGTRTFVADFFDTSGNHATAPRDLTLSCEGSGDEVGACGGHCMSLLSQDHCGACNAGCNFMIGFQNAFCSSPGLCIGGFVVTQGSRSSCTAECAAQAPGSTCTSATVYRFLTSASMTVPCNHVEGASTWPTTITLSRLDCECYTPGQPWDVIPKIAGQTCQSACTARLQMCGVTSYSGVLGTGESVFGADVCQAPYLRGNFDGVNVGATIAITDTDASYQCECGVPAR